MTTNALFFREIRAYPTIFYIYSTQNFMKIKWFRHERMSRRTWFTCQHSLLRNDQLKMKVCQVGSISSASTTVFELIKQQ
jgi:hypothetical protein